MVARLRFLAERVMARGSTETELRELYERFAPMIHRRAMAILGRDADAWDVVQEVFERLLRSRADFRGEARPSTYVYRIATNAALNLLRGRVLREQSNGTSVAEGTTDQSSTEAGNVLRALTRRLTERQLEVAALYLVDGLTQEEIAQVLGLSRKTVVREVQEIRVRAEELVQAPLQRSGHE